MVIKEALDDLLNNNLDSMRQKLTHALNEKAVQKLDERKNEIANKYFAQGK